MKAKLVLALSVLAQLACSGDARTEESDPGRLREECTRARVQDLLHCETDGPTSGQACEEYRGDVCVGRVVWPAATTLSLNRGVLWLAVRTPEGTPEYSILVVSDACESITVRSVPDLRPLLPERAWDLPSETLINLPKLVLGVSQMGRAISGVLGEVKRDHVMGRDLFTYGCETAEDFAPKHLSREGQDSELRQILTRYPAVEVSSSLARVSLLCRFDDLDGSIQVVTVSFKEGRSVEIAYRKTGLRISDGIVRPDHEFSPQW